MSRRGYVDGDGDVCVSVLGYGDGGGDGDVCVSVLGYGDVCVYVTTPVPFSSPRISLGEPVSSFPFTCSGPFVGCLSI